MTTIAQGLFKKTTFGKQVALGTPKTGAGGQVLRRKTSVFTASRDMSANEEIVSHLQDTGQTYGQKKASGKIDGVLSPLTYSILMAGIMRGAFAATAAYSAGNDVTAQVAAPQFVDASAGFLTAGLKVGDVGRWTGFAGANNARNFWITALTGGNMTGVFLDGLPAVVEAPGPAVTFTVVGKKVFAPFTAQTNDYFTFEEWYSDLAKSEVYPDCKINQIQLGLPATGNATVAIDVVGVGTRTLAGSESFTAPTAETTTQPVQALHGFIYANEAAVTYVNALSITIDSGISPIGASIGSSVSPDLNQSRLKVSGTFTAMFQNSVLSALLDAETNIALACVIAADNSATGDFIAFTMGRVKITGDTPDDGEKAVMRTYPFTAELNGNGGAALAYDKTILTIQDSQAA